MRKTCRDEFAALDLYWRIRNVLLAELLRQELDRQARREIHDMVQRPPVTSDNGAV